MNYQPPLKLLAPAAARDREPSSDDYELVIRQKPVAAKLFIGKEKDRKPVDPPPIIQLGIRESLDPSQNFLQSPYFFVSCSLLDDDEIRSQADRDETRHGLAGTLVSSLHRLKDIDNTDGGFFVFGDLSVKVEGTFKLQFTLFEVRDKEVAYIKSVTSEPFTVYASKYWPGMAESTLLTRSFSDQGVRLRLRKEPRSRLGARGPASDNYEPRRYKIQNRVQSQTDPQESLQTQQEQSWPQEGGGDYAEMPDGYPARQQNKPFPSPSPVLPAYQKKREYSHSSHSGSHASYSEESFLKRTRTDSEHTHQQTYGSQQYSVSPDYGQKLYSVPSQASTPTYPSSPHQLYSSSLTSSPLSMIPREQANYFIPRRAGTQFPSISSTHESPGGRMSNTHSQRSPFRYDYTTPHQSVNQSFSNLQHPQHQFIPQLSQPMPPIRAPTSMAVYGTPVDSEQASALPRPTILMSSDMPPPVLGRTLAPGVGAVQSGLIPLPSMGGDMKDWRVSMFDNRPRNDNAYR